MEESVFDIPLLLDEISQYLSESDLRNCICVSRIWSARFIPILWRTVDFSSRNLKYNLNTFRKGQTHVRTIKFGSSWFSEVISGAHGHKHPFHFHFPSLRSLHWRFSYHCLQEPESFGLALDFFKAHPTLRDISFNLDIIAPGLVAALDKSNLPALRSLYLFGGNDIKGDTSVQQLIHACARLEFLYIIIERYKSHSEGPNTDLYQERKAIMENMPTTRLRCLTIELCCPSQEAVTLVPLLRKSPLLQELRIHFSPGNDMSRSIATILRDEGCCPELRTLSIMQDKITDSELAELINACTSHTSLSGNHRSSLITTTSNKVHRNLKDLTIASRNFGPLTIKSLAQNFAQSLVALNIAECEYVCLSKVTALVSSLPGLQKLIVGRIYFVSEVRGGTNSLVNALETPWVCRGLEFLSFDLFWSNAMDYGDEDDSDMESYGNTDYGSTGEADTNDMTDLADFRSRCLSCFWDRVGELENLRYLSYDGEEFPLVTSTENNVTYLDQLRGLKKMQTLEIYFYSTISVKQAEWLMLYWPNLSHIMGLKRRHNKDCSCSQQERMNHECPLEQCKGMAVLKTARPWIIID
ncbi:hypothetical protein BGX21_007808 [Mortierella sp. AD011]|nr:hypothetical protein BGX20_007801 [Mortierella sp. AD010]KAF9398429.1 hypothetical protein BGX21_007808 [Mortierella sp. AD011]